MQQTLVQRSMQGGEPGDVRKMAMTGLTSLRPRAARSDRSVRAMATGVIAAALLLSPGVAMADATVNSTYSISIAGLPIGRANVETHFDGAGYSLTINGFTSGISRLVSDASASMTSSGRIYGSRIVAANYRLDTQESGLSTSVRMRLSDGDITSLKALPELSQREHRIPVTGRDRQNVVDPISAFLLPADNPRKASGSSACNRTLRIFDGWQRFDVRLSYRESREIENTGDDSYSGPVFICSARYVPVAGHVTDAEAVRYMADNTNLEVWVAPVAGLPVLVPYNIVIGTKIGTLSVRATKVSVVGQSLVRRAAAD